MHWGVRDSWLTNLLGRMDTWSCHWLTGLYSLQLFFRKHLKFLLHSFAITFYSPFKNLSGLSSSDSSNSSLTCLNCQDHYMTRLDANISVPCICFAFTAAEPYWKKNENIFKKERKKKAEQIWYHWATEKLGGRGPTGQQPQLQTIIGSDEWC